MHAALRMGLLLAVAALIAPVARAQSNQQLGADLENPISRLVRVPILFDYDRGIGPEAGGDRFNLVTLQPIVPVALNDDWNLILNTNVRMVYQSDVLRDSSSDFGLGDLTQAFYLSPEKPGPGGFVFGAGPIVLLPTATDPILGAEQWGIGPAVAAVRQDGPWTMGVIAHHLWSFAGDEDRLRVNRSFVQPFIAYTTPTAWTFSLNTEALYDWQSSEWLTPINLQISKVLRIGDYPVSIGAGMRYWADSTPSGPEGFGARISLVFLFPR